MTTEVITIERKVDDKVIQTCLMQYNFFNSFAVFLIIKGGKGKWK